MATDTVSNVAVGAGAGAAAAEATQESAVFQTKRVPFDDLHLGIQSELMSRKQNVVGRQRQQVVVCASLIDKVANLAGIARTCEIFAVERLVMSNLKVCATDTFQGIAVSCTEWLPMLEVPAEDLQPWLANMRRQGYCILGLEQTDYSVNLAAVDTDTAGAFSKCVLLLGKEREGIPVELLQEVDVCLEIPQYGIVRSLNVHVSAAIAMWEITKKNKIPVALDNDV
jgi:tRNA G18 (ribose-2'-O)-methylase SpoU